MPKGIQAGRHVGVGGGFGGFSGGEGKERGGDGMGAQGRKWWADEGAELTFACVVCYHKSQY